MNIKRLLLSLFVVNVFSLVLFSAEADADTLVNRISGQNRYETSAAIAKYGWKNAEYAVIASGTDFADALAAAPLAAKYNAPILLNGSYGIRYEVLQALGSLHVTKVFIVGGPGAVPADVDGRLENMGIKVTRIAGQDRYETAVNIAKMLGEFNEIAVATGEDFPDALSIAPFAAKKQIPIILVPKDDIPECVDRFIKSSSISCTYVIGDSTAVSFETEIEFPGVQRIGSLDRYFTNSYVEKRFSDVLNSGKVFIISADDFPDGLSCSVLAGMSNSPIVFLSNDYKSQAEYIFNNYNEAVFVGDTSVISRTVEQSFESTGKIIKKLSSQKRFGYPYIDKITYDGGYIYYHRKDVYSGSVIYGEESIYRMRQDGSGNMKLATIGGSNVDGRTYKYVLDHINDFKISKNFKEFHIEGEWLYYSFERDDTVYKIKKDGSTE